jgi:hypothetical protein
MSVANALAYYDMAKIAAVKSCIVQALGGNLMRPQIILKMIFIISYKKFSKNYCSNGQTNVRIRS